MFHENKSETFFICSHQFQHAKADQDLLKARDQDEAGNARKPGPCRDQTLRIG
jgi:hypothetical protein